MKIRIVHASLAFCLSSASAAVGQTPQPPSIAHTGGTNSTPLTLEQENTAEQQGLLDRASATSLHAGHYAKAEAEARQALSLGLDSGVANEVLGAALAAQGKTQEALQTYHAMVIEGKDGPTGQVRVLLPYAMLLLKSGQWEKAVIVYNHAVPDLPDVGFHSEFPVVHDGDVIQANSHFSADVPQPVALATAIHIAQGMIYNDEEDWAGEPQNSEAFAEYAKALQLAPASNLANYYYGVGWQKLSPAERTKFGCAQQAKAALTKAVKLSKGPLKKAAQKALRVAMNTK